MVGSGHPCHVGRSVFISYYTTLNIKFMTHFNSSTVRVLRSDKYRCIVLVSRLGGKGNDNED